MAGAINSSDRQSLSAVEMSLMGIALSTGTMSLHHGRIDPDGPAVRYDLAHLFLRILRSANLVPSRRPTGFVQYVDVPRVSPSFEPVAWIWWLQLLGCWDSKFRGDEPVSRGMVVALLGRLLRYVEHPVDPLALQGPPDTTSHGSAVVIPGPVYQDQESWLSDP